MTDGREIANFIIFARFLRRNERQRKLNAAVKQTPTKSASEYMLFFSFLFLFPSSLKPKSLAVNSLLQAPPLPSFSRSRFEHIWTRSVANSHHRARLTNICVEARRPTLPNAFHVLLHFR